MLYRDPIDDFITETDIGRPFIDDSNRKEWLEFHNWILNSDVRIGISSAFHMIYNICENFHEYNGIGYSYTFWFMSEEDKEVFLNKYKEIILGENDD